MLKLVYKAEPIQEPRVIEEAQLKERINLENCEGFQVEVEMKGPDLYSMEIHDYSNCLSTELTLEVEGQLCDEGKGSLICHFPEIDDEPLNTMIWEDETLYAIIMIQFQMKIMKELFLLCHKLQVSRLVLYPDDANMEDFEIYQDFLIEDDLQAGEDEGHTKLVLLADSEAYMDWVEFMSEASVRFQQTLWKDQRKNSAIRSYLSTHPFGSSCWDV